MEDNELNQEIASEFIRMMGAESEIAGNGKEAVSKFAASEEGYYDLILMDILMPEMGGYEASGIIRSMKRKDAGTVPIFAMTANAFAEDVEKHISANRFPLPVCMRRWIRFFMRINGREIHNKNGLTYLIKSMS